MGHTKVPELAGELGARLRIHDPPGIDQRLRRSEQLDPFQEEGPLLRKEQRKPLVDRDLTLVTLHLTEIGIHRGVERVAAEPEPQVQAAVGIEIFPHEIPAYWIAGSRRGGGHERLRLHRNSVVHVVEPAQRALLSQKAGIGPAHIGPGVGISGALYYPGHIEPPALRAACRIAQTLERNPDLHLEAPISDP